MEQRRAISGAEDLINDYDPIADRKPGELNAYVEGSIMNYVRSGWEYDLIAENFSLPISDIEFVVAKHAKAEAHSPR